MIASCSSPANNAEQTMEFPDDRDDRPCCGETNQEGVIEICRMCHDEPCLRADTDCGGVEVAR